MPKQKFTRNPIDIVVHGSVAIALIVSVTILGVTRVLNGNEVLVALLSGGSATAVLTVADGILYGVRSR